MDADYDVVILGAGAAGLSAGLYTARAMMKTLIVECLGTGGQLMITDEVENYPGFPHGAKGPQLAMDISSSRGMTACLYGTVTEIPSMSGCSTRSTVAGSSSSGIAQVS